MKAEEVYNKINESCDPRSYDIILYINNGFMDAASYCIQYLYKCDIETAREVAHMFEYELHENK